MPQAAARFAFVRPWRALTRAAARSMATAFPSPKQALSVSRTTAPTGVRRRCYSVAVNSSPWPPDVSSPGGRSVSWINSPPMVQITLTGHNGDLSAAPAGSPRGGPYPGRGGGTAQRADPASPRRPGGRDPGRASPRVAVTLLSISRPEASGTGKRRRNHAGLLEPTGGLEPPTR